MTRDRIGKKTLEEQLPAILREQYRKDGFPPDHLPSWEYITANTRYTAEGLNNKSKQLYGQTLLEHLRKLGFGIRSDGEWPTDDEETIRSLEYYIQVLEEKKLLADSTINSIESAINKAYKAIREENLDTDLLQLGQFDSEEERITNIQRTITILEYMDHSLDDGTLINYSDYLSDYYDIAGNRYLVNFNPIEPARQEFRWYRTWGDPQPITESQLNDLWNVLNTLDECPVQGYDLQHWRLWLKMLIVFLIAVGPRSNEIERLDLRTQLHLGADPHVRFEERKNLRNYEDQVTVPIMTGVGFIRAYRDFIEETDQNGKLVPSLESESGCRTPRTLNEWIKRLCKLANVRLDDGSYPTIQNFRQFWKTQYKKALQENREQIKFLSQEDGKKGPESDERDYIDDVVNRQHTRELGRKYFDDILDFGDLPELVQNELDQNEYTNRQSRIADYNSFA